MKKDIAKQLNEIAEELPIIFEVKIGSTQMSGYELNLTPLSDHQKFEKEKMYSVPVPEYHAVEHKQQLKDAYKRGGIGEVKCYVRKVMADYQTSESIKVAV